MADDGRGYADLLAARLAEAEAQRQAALEEARKAAEASRSSTGAAAAGTATEEGPVAAPPGSDGILVTPTPGRQSAYGWRIHPVYGVRRLHAGTDMRAACGTPVYAAEDGEVVRAGVGSGYGNIIIVDHGTVAGRPVATASAHLSRFAAGVGDAVERGELIAYSGSTGVGTACHLHFEVRVSGSAVDATPWL